MLMNQHGSGMNRHVLGLNHIPVPACPSGMGLYGGEMSVLFRMLLFAVGSQWQRVKALDLRTAEAEAALPTSELYRLEA